jgi:hypothetical protein
MTENEKKILAHLHLRYPDQNATNVELTRHLRIDKEDFYTAINKLMDKEYIKEITVDNQRKDNLQSWAITLDGALYFNTLNYQSRVDKIAETQMVQGRNVVLLTSVIAFGTTVAAVYYFLEVHDKHPQMAYYILGAITTLLLLILVGLTFLKRNKS